MNVIGRLFGKTKTQKDQETLRREYEEAKYDHYLAFGNAFMNFCNWK